MASQDPSGSGTGTKPENSLLMRLDGLIGSVLGDRYLILSMVQAGGMGVVYRARHIHLEKLVAVKVMRAAQDEAARQRFLLEARVASMLHHSNIVDVIDFGVLPVGLPYLVMEFLEGKTLEQVLIESAPLPPRRVCHIGAQIARGLQAVHEKGIIHRDLKPPNIFLLEREGQRDVVKIVDFGVAKIHDGPKLTAAGMTMGTAEYMSPEQGTGLAIDHRSDQYALGCLLYEMLTNELPFSGTDPTAILLRHMSEPVVPPRDRCPQLYIPESLQAIVMQALAKDPAQRFVSMAAFSLALVAEEERLQQELDQVFAGPAPHRPEAPAQDLPPPAQHDPAPTVLLATPAQADLPKQGPGPQPRRWLRRVLFFSLLVLFTAGICVLLANWLGHGPGGTKTGTLPVAAPTDARPAADGRDSETEEVGAGVKTDPVLSPDGGPSEMDDVADRLKQKQHGHHRSHHRHGRNAE